MGTSNYFNNYGAINEQRLVEDIIVESIKIMGFDAFYIPIFNVEDRDMLYGEDPLKKFKTAYPLEMYLSSALQYDGEREFFSKFGLEIRNEVSVIVSKRSFTQRVPQNQFNRPREGDLIYIPVLNGTGELYEITFTDHTKDFFQLGRKVPFFYELKLEKYRYSQELIDTGIPDIDNIDVETAYTIDYHLGSGTGNYKQREVVFQSADNTLANSSCSGTVMNWSAPDKILSVAFIKGEFVDGHVIVGATSNSHYTLTTYNPLDVNVKNDSYDNAYLQTLGQPVINNDEQNPLNGLL